MLAYKSFKKSYLVGNFGLLNTIGSIRLVFDKSWWVVLGLQVNTHKFVNSQLCRGCGAEFVQTLKNLFYIKLLKTRQTLRIVFCPILTTFVMSSILHFYTALESCNKTIINLKKEINHEKN